MMDDYLRNLKEVLDKIDLKKVNNIVDLIEDSKTIFAVGNGGSHATAEHFVVDLMKMSNKKAYSISNVSLLTMCANDFGYEHSFNWVIEKMVSEKDLIIGITTSGKSANVIRSSLNKLANKNVLISGIGGRDITEDYDESIIIETHNTQIIEDVAAILCHMIALELKRRRNR